jgi:predicted exporter
MAATAPAWSPLERQRAVRRWAQVAVWIALIAALSWYVQRDLKVGTDMRLFMPSPTTPEQRLLLEEVGEGAAARVLVVGLADAPAEQLAEISSTLAASLKDSSHFRWAANGDVALDVVPEELLPYRFLLSSTLDTQALDADYLHRQLLMRAQDLASPAGAFLEELLPRDPTLELVTMLNGWQPQQQPARQYDVWFDRAGRQALLVLETVAGAFDSDRQRQALDELQAAFAAAARGTPATLTVSGNGVFSTMIEKQARSEATGLGIAATVGMVVLLLVAYRRLTNVLLGALPLASAGVAGLAAVSMLFDSVHGITLAFGFTLIGVAQDYPMHLFSHQRAGRTPLEVVRELWPTLVTGVASTCIAYFTFLFSGVVGLGQLACFTVTALAVAALTTRFVLPRLTVVVPRDHGDSRFLERLWHCIESIPHPSWLAPALAAACVAALLLNKQPMWENDLSTLTPLPLPMLERDQALRAELGTPDVRYLMAVEATDNEQALERLARLQAPLDGWVQRGVIDSYDSAARYLPTRQLQLQRQQKLPDAATLRSALQAALQGTPFRADAFEPFLADVEHARSLPPLALAQLQRTALGSSLEMLLLNRETRVTALVTFTGVRDPQALRAGAAALGSDVTLLDLKDASETLIARQRSRILWSLAVASLLMIGVVSLALRQPQRVYRVLAPMALTTLLVLTILQLGGVSLSLFHLIALILAAGLGLDYALFFEHAADDPREQRRTLHAVLVCSLSTLMVFALLSTSSLPVLRAIGITVTLGVISNFVLALLLTRGDTPSVSAVTAGATPADPTAAP